MFEAVEHVKAYDYMFTLIRNKQITENDIRYLDKLFYKNIDEESAGEYRDVLALIPPILRIEYISLLEKAHTDDSTFKFHYLN